MQKQSFKRAMVVIIAILAAACMSQRSFAATNFVQHNLVSDIPLLADFTDANLVNPWGITISAASPFWLCDQRTGLSTVYTASATVAPGTISATVVTVPPPPGKTTPGACTGIVVGSGGFAVTPGNNASFIFDTEDGTISAWNRTADATHAIIKVDNSGSGAVYKGLAIASNGSATFLYAANFNSGAIDVFDSNFAKATLAGSFADPGVPSGFAPFNIQNLGGKLYVTYAKQDSAKHDDVAGPGNGYVSVFDLSGNLLQHLVSQGRLNSPWGVAIAPASWGDFAGALLVGNFRDGSVNAYDNTGKFLATLSDPSGKPIVNVGLWGLQFGNGGSGGDPNKMYFAAGISGGGAIQSHGLFGVISVAAVAGAAPAVNDKGIVSTACYAACGLSLAPGSMAAIFGTNLTDGSSCLHASGCDPTFDNIHRLRTTMAGAQVLINGSPVPIFYATPLTLGVEIPSELTGTTATLQVVVNGQASNTQTFAIASFTPGIFTQNNQGTGSGAFTHADSAGTAVDAQHPASPNETLILYMTGLGQVSPSVATGGLPAATTNTSSIPTVTVDGLTAVVPFSGLSGCCVALNQVNFVVPASVHTGTNVNVVVSTGGTQSNTVTLAIGGGSTPTASPSPAPILDPTPAPTTPAPSPALPDPPDVPPYDGY